MIQKLGRTVIAALCLIAGGFIVIALAWNGSARVNCVDCQIPYLLSGGAIGLGLIGIGSGLLLFESGKRAVAHLEAKLDEVVKAIGEGGTGSTNHAAPKQPVSMNGAVVVGRSSFHRPDCRLVEGKEDLDYASLDEALDRGLQPCRVCDPLKTGEPAVPRRRKR